MEGGVDEEKPLSEHVIELLETVRKILIYNIAFILLLFMVPSSPNFLKGYTPLIFSLMQRVQSDMLSFRENPVAAPIARVLGVNGSEVMLIANGWFDSLVGALYLAALIAIVAMGPVTVYLVYRYVEPGLYEHEKRAVKKYLAVIFFLFTTGVVYAYYVIMPIMFAVAVWLTVIGGARPIFSIQDFYDTILVGCVSTGVMFMLPLFILLIAKLGFIDSETLKRNWRMVTFAIFAVTAILTPDPTPVSMLALSVPFVALYTASVWLVERVEKKEREG